MSRFIGKMVDDEDLVAAVAAATPSSKIVSDVDPIKGNRSCHKCGGFAKDSCQICPKTGKIARSGFFAPRACTMHGHGRRTLFSFDHNDQGSVDYSVYPSAGIGRRLLGAIKQAFVKPKTTKESAHNLQEILGDLRYLNGWLEGRVRCNESRYSYWKTMLEKEERRLEENYSALKGSQQSINHLRCRMGCVNDELVNMIESERRRIIELEQAESMVKRHEPSLYRKYQSLLGKQGNKDCIFNDIHTRVDEKRKALDKMEFLLAMWQENVHPIKESQSAYADDNPVTMCLPTKLQLLSHSSHPSEACSRRFHFNFPIGPDAACADSASSEDIDDST